MRVTAALSFLFLAVAVTAASGVVSAPTTDLKITVWSQGKGGTAKRWTLRCNPAGGTLPRAGRACTALARLENPFAPVPPDAVCTQIYGGPEEALVTGRHRGRSVWARFARTDGCHIARWNRVAFLFPIDLE